jgi:hypothetical protein
MINIPERWYFAFPSEIKNMSSLKSAKNMLIVLKSCNP